MTALSWIGLAACTRSIAISPVNLPTLASYREARRPFAVRDGDRDLVLSPDLRPTLELELRGCSWWRTLLRRCDRVIRVPLDQVGWDGEALSLPVKTSVFLDRFADRRVPLAAIDEAALLIHPPPPGSDRPPRFGLGLAILGPSVLFGLQFQYLPRRWLAIEVGTLPAADLALFYAGARFRPLSLGPVTPFVGGFANVTGAYNAATGESSSQKSAGPRLGVDLQLGRVLVTTEVELVRTFEPDEPLVGDLKGRWLVFGGGAVSYTF